MNLKTILNSIFVFGIFDKLRFYKNHKQKNIKEKSIKQNTLLKKDFSESPSYTNINYEYKPSSRKPYRRIKTQSQPKNFSIESTREWKCCPKCNKKINVVAKKCPYCDYQIMIQKDNDYEFDTTSSTKYIEKNGFSFNYPEYYDIGAVESKNEIFKTIVGLSKNDDRTCEIYVTE